jgi:integrase
MVASTAPKHKYDIHISAADLETRRQELSMIERMALEANSWKAVESVERCYTTFCRSANLKAFPVSYESLGLYLIQYCRRFGHTTRTIPTIVSHLKRANRRFSTTWMDEASQLRLDDLIAGLRKFDRTAPARKLPMTHRVMADIQRVADATTHKHFQHIVMSKVAREALLRAKELLQLRHCDIRWNDTRTTVTITIHMSKANKVGPPEHVTLTDFGATSAVAHLRCYMEVMAAGFPKGTSTQPLWPSISENGTVFWATATTKLNFVALARQLLTKAGYPAMRYSGHSYRSGGATDLWDSQRCRPLTIKLHGRWKSDAYLLYIRDNPERTAAEVTQALAFFNQAMSA